MKKLLTLVLIISMGMIQAFATTITKSGYITADETWTKNNVYRLSGFVYITNNVTVTIEPGTLIYGEKSTKGALIVTRGGNLIADGTACEPIVFTSEQPLGTRTYGDWGGIIILGKATINQPGGEAIIEGGVDDGEGSGTYGGGLTPDDNDNSGTLRYVRIEFPGIAFQANNEINGLTCGGVGAGTIIEHIQVSYSGDDSYEFFGGTVNCKWLVALRGLDDDFDTDNGYRGKIQFAVSLRDPDIADVSGSNGFESDNDATGSNNTPETQCVYSNVSVFGPLETTSTTINVNYKRGAHIRRNSAMNLHNSILAGFPDGVFLDGTSTIDNWCGGTLKFENNVISGWTLNDVTPASGGTGTCFTKAAFLASSTTYANNSGLDINDPFNLTNPNFLPNGSSPMLSGASFTGLTDPFWTPVSYRGAFGNSDWTKPWANFDPNNTTYSGAISNKPSVTSGVITKQSCPNTGGVDITVTGGVEPYTYLWSNGQTNQDLTNVNAATYTVTVTAVGGCTTSKTYVVASKSVPKPAGVVINNPTACTMNLSWNAVSVAGSYKLRYRVTGTTVWTNISGSTTALNYTFTGLMPSTSYDLSVRTVCASDGTTTSGWVQKTGSTTNVCGQPTNLAATFVGQTTATISWTGTCNAVTYNLQYRKTGTTLWTSVNTASTSANLTGLTANTQYDYRVRSECSGSNSAYTAIQTFTTALRLTQDADELSIKGVNIFPNPANNHVTVEITSNASKVVNVQLVNTVGQVVAQFNNIIVEGISTLNIDCSKFNSGNYFINIYDGAEVLSHQIVINK